MATNSNCNGSSFRIKRPRITSNGFVSEVDPTIKKHLDELNKLLGKRIFAVTIDSGQAPATPNPVPRTRRPGAAKAEVAEISTDPDLKEILKADLTPKRTPPHHGKWKDDSLAYRFDEADELKTNNTLTELLEKTKELSALKFAFDAYLSANYFNLEFNTRTVLAYPALKDYLLAYSYFVQDLRDLNAIKNSINRSYAKMVANYAIVSAARTFIDAEHLKVRDYNDDDSNAVTQIVNKNLSLSAASYKTGLKAVINDLVFNAKFAAIVDAAAREIGPFPPEARAALIRYVKSHQSLPITEENAAIYLGPVFAQMQTEVLSGDQSELDTEEADRDFDVDFFEDDTSMIQVSKSAVRCAAQLFYSMTLGDELDIFNVVNFFTHKYLIRGGLEIQDNRLRDDLQQYVFSNKFTDQATSKIIDRTRPAERQMFYRQVFNYGMGQITEDVIVNNEFSRLWKVLILESAKYLERAQASFNPDSFVSRQNVMQAVEDLQYNLSTHCTGMANVITPIIYAELNFVVQRIFMNKEILRQVVPQGGTWWRVVETLYMGMKNVRPRSTVIYNKAKLGHDILKSIADYDPSTFENDEIFSAFISNVDAFITTQSILQEALTDDLKKDVDDDEPSQNGYPKTMPDVPAMAAAPSATVTADEWDF
jgi:hypothetical protein